MTERTHVLLDLDGTLSDSSLGIGRSLQHAFAACGYDPLTNDQILSMIGPPLELSFPRVGVRPEDVEPIIDCYRERYEDVGLFENEMYDGVPEMLRALETAGFTLAVATAKPEQTAVRIIEHFGISNHFAVQVGASLEVGSSRRTKAAVITETFARLGIDGGHHAVMVGDRDHDVEGAHANGIDCIGVTWGFGSAHELTTSGANPIVNSPADVVAAVSRSYR